MKPRLSGTIKYRVPFPIHKKLLINLSIKGGSLRIQNVLHLKFTGVFSLKVKKSGRSIHNASKRLMLTHMKLHYK